MRTKYFLMTLVVVATIVGLLVLRPAKSSAAQQQQIQRESQPQSQEQAQTFTSAAQTAQVLYEAAKANDGGALRSILGAGPELVFSGVDGDNDPNRAQFVRKYEEMHRLVRESDGSTILYIGAENWPFPIPLVETSGKWRFDADAGSDEILARHIGRDEITAIQVCQAFANKSDADDLNDSIKEVGAALHDLPSENSNASQYEGYYFRVLGKRPGGAVLIAYPAEYRLSGVMTFMVTADGSVYENDLGPHTATIARQIQTKPKKNWVVVH